MCGICGYTNENLENIGILQNMMEKIAHRGPDGEGIYQKGKTALGFRRLSIIDLDNGDQPMYNEDHNLVVVFNGEIYNYQELRKELMMRGHYFRTDSDTECLLHAYEEYGKEMVYFLRGMFAFAIWDEVNKTLFAARDPFGIKPFYYFQKPDGGIVFASEIKSLLDHPVCPREVNEMALDCYLSFQYSVLEETFFKGIYKLMPYHWLIWENGRINTESYGKLELQPEKTEKKRLPGRSKQKEECKGRKQKLQKALEDSIKIHQKSDVEVGVLLSSGVDSNYINVRSKVKQSFSVGFEEEDGIYNELTTIRKNQKHMDHNSHSYRGGASVNHQKNISAKEFWNAVPEVMYYMDEPLGDSSAVALYFVDQLAAEHLKVVLSGEGADELFGGYPIYGEPKGLALFTHFSDKTKAGMKEFVKKIPFYFKGKNYILRGCEPLEQRFIGNAKIFSPEEKKRLLKTGRAMRPYAVTGSLYHQNQSLDDVSRMQEIDLNFWLPGDILLKADKMSMAHSLECRVPYLDKEVYRMSCSLTTKDKIQKGHTKVLFRKIAGEVLPEKISQKPKLGFPVPIRVWLRQPEYYERVKRIFQSPAAERFFQVNELERLLEEHRNKIQDHSRKIWTVYAFLIWYEVYFAAEKTEVKKH